MLSILIPVHNYSVVSLVDALSAQASELKEKIQILVLDDGSESKYLNTNQSIQDMPGVVYDEMGVNIGRSKIRNLLAAKAREKNLLFLDCDVMPARKDFLKEYLVSLKKADLVCGGLLYSDTPPEDDSKYFHWYYGTNRETRSAIIRNQNPYHSFLSSNFLIRKDVFEGLTFDESLKEYGHEDTLFGVACEAGKINILHINNPVIHHGLDSLPVFLEKRLKSIDNLIQILDGHPKAEAIKEHVNLLNAGSRIQKLKLGWISEKTLKISQSLIIRKLQRKNPDLRIFDLYRLQYYLEKSNQKK